MSTRSSGAKGGGHNSSTLPSKYPHLGLNSVRIKKTSLRVYFTNATDSGQSNSASVRRRNLRPTLSTIGVLRSTILQTLLVRVEATDSDPRCSVATGPGIGSPDQPGR